MRTKFSYSRKCVRCEKEGKLLCSDSLSELKEALQHDNWITFDGDSPFVEKGEEICPECLKAMRNSLDNKTRLI